MQEQSTFLLYDLKNHNDRSVPKKIGKKFYIFMYKEKIIIPVV